MASAISEEFGQAAEELLGGAMRRESVREELAAGFSREAWNLVAETGWSEVLVPESEDGLGLGTSELGPIFAAVGRHLLPGPLLEHATLLPLLVELGPDAWGERLAPLRAGTAMLAAPGLGLREERLPRLAGGRLSGTVAGVRYAPLAAELLVVCAGEDGSALALVPAAADGVEVVARESLDPIVSVADVRLDGATVAAPCEGDAAAELLRRAVALGRLMSACELVGLAERSQEMAVAYAKERHQFGKPVGAFQAVQHLLAEAERTLHGLQCLCRDSLAAADRDREWLPECGEVAKAGASAPARAIVETSLQVHGGIAFTMEHAMHGYYTHTLGLEALFGGTRELSRRLGMRLIEGPSWPGW